MFLLCSRTAKCQCSVESIQATVQGQRNFTPHPVYTQCTFINTNMFGIRYNSHGGGYCDVIEYFKKKRRPLSGNVTVNTL
jgi:hypothetical protein